MMAKTCEDKLVTIRGWRELQAASLLTESWWAITIRSDVTKHVVLTHMAMLHLHSSYFLALRSIVPLRCFTLSSMHLTKRLKHSTCASLPHKHMHISDINTNSMTTTTTWKHGIEISIVRCMNEVNLHRARLVLGWLTTSSWVCHLSM